MITTELFIAKGEYDQALEIAYDQLDNALVDIQVLVREEFGGSPEVTPDQDDLEGSNAIWRFDIEESQESLYIYAKGDEITAELASFDWEDRDQGYQEQIADYRSIALPLQLVQQIKSLLVLARVIGYAEGRIEIV